jgi:hypothetical protein
MVKAAPGAVLHPAVPTDIAALIRSSSSSPAPFPLAARGMGHSWRGQALASGGVVVDMRALGRGHRAHINVSAAAGAEPYVETGGKQMWIDVLHATLKHGFAPRAWTDYLRLTVRRHALQRRNPRAGVPARPADRQRARTDQCCHKYNNITALHLGLSQTSHTNS